MFILWVILIWSVTMAVLLQRDRAEIARRRNEFRKEFTSRLDNYFKDLRRGKE